MREVYPELKKLVPELEAVAELLRVNFLKPVLAGQPIRMLPVHTDATDTSLLTNVRVAVEGAGGVTPSGVSRIEELEDEDESVDDDDEDSDEFMEEA